MSDPVGVISSPTLPKTFVTLVRIVKSTRVPVYPTNHTLAMVYVFSERYRGQVATQEEKDSAMDLLFQLEALNPTPDATNVNIIGASHIQKLSNNSNHGTGVL